MNTPLTNARNGFQGIWPALLTPLNEHLDIDHGKFATHAKALLAAGCTGVTPFGTTGEGPSFSMEERREALERLIANGVPAERIIVSTSCAALPETLALTRHAVQLGTHGCLMLPPFYFKGVSDEGIVNAYAQVIDGVGRSDWRLYPYHLPQVAGVGLTQAVIAELLRRYPGVIAGIKDSGCERAFSVALAQAFMPGITIYVGNEPDLPTLGRMGSTGAISGLANFLPRVVRRMVLQPDAATTPHDTQRVQDMLNLLKPHALLPGLKSVMATLQQDPAWLRVRAPLLSLSPSAHATLAQTVRAFAIDTQRE